MGWLGRTGGVGGRRTLPGMSLLHRLLHRGSESTHASGAVIPLRPDDVPQGLGYDEEHGDFVITYYDAADPRRGSLVFTEGQGRVSARVELGFVLGDPAYYGRFGFEAATARGFDSPYAGEYFLGIRLNDGPCVHTPGAAVHARAFAALGEDA